MLQHTKENVMQCLTALEFIKDGLAEAANETATEAQNADGEARGKLAAEAVALFNLVNSSAKALAVFEAHTRHFKREVFVIEVIA